MGENNTFLREELAETQHEIWSNWMEYLFSVSINNGDGTYTIPANKAERWMRQINTPYSELTENEKESDREQADKVVVTQAKINRQNNFNK